MSDLLSEILILFLKCYAVKYSMKTFGKVRKKRDGSTLLS